MIDSLLAIALSNLALSAALALLAWCVHRRGTRPGLAHALWVLVLVKLVTPPLFSVPLLPALQTQAVAQAAPAAESIGERLPHAHRVPTQASALPLDPDGSGTAADARGSFGWPALLVAIWLAGSVVVLAWSLLRVVRFDRLLRRASSPAPQRIVRCAHELGDLLRLRRLPELRVTIARVSPLVWWVGGRVRVVVPEELLSTMSPEEVRWVIAHELAHVKRRDHMVRWLEWLACVACWWNPITWIARRQLRQSEEICCDALVLRRLSGRPRAYAGALMHVIEFLAAPALRPPAIASEITSGGTLERRFRIMLHRTTSPTPRWLTASVLIACAGLLPLGVETVTASTGVVSQAEAASREAMIDALRRAVGLGLSEQEARLLYESAVFPKTDLAQKIDAKFGVIREKIERAREGGQIAPEEADTQLAGLREKYRMYVHAAFFTDVLGLDQGEALERAMALELDSGTAVGDSAAHDAAVRTVMERARAAADDHVQARVDAIDAELATLVESGQITEAEAKKQAAAVRAEIANKKLSIVTILSEITAAVASGELTPEEGERLKSGLSQRQAENADEAAGGEVVRKQLAEAFMKAGMHRDQIDSALVAIKRIVAEMKTEGGHAGFDPSKAEWLDEMGLTNAQVEMLVRLSKHLAVSRDADAARADIDAHHKFKTAVERIEAAVKAGKITREEADEQLASIRTHQTGTPGR